MRRIALKPTSHSTPAVRLRGAFTLTELLVVLAVIVLILGIAVPTVNLLSGRQSMESAQNHLAAMLSQARGRAQTLQRESGLLLFIDPASERVTARLVEVVGREPNSGVRLIDLVAGSDPQALPAGVALQFPTGGAQRYTGFDRLTASTAAVGGAILFDAQGRLIVVPFWYRGVAGGQPTALGQLTGVTSNTPPASPPHSRLGMVLFDRATFVDRFDFEDTSDPDGEEQWLDENGRLLLINRYSGTFVE